MFTVFKKVTSKNAIITDEDVTKVSDYVFCRWLSGNAGTLRIAQMFNFYSKIPLDVKLKVAQKIIGGKVRYIPYPKSGKIKLEDVDLLKEYFNISDEKAKMYLEFISKEELDGIRLILKSKSLNSCTK